MKLANKRIAELMAAGVAPADYLEVANMRTALHVGGVESFSLSQVARLRGAVGTNIRDIAGVYLEVKPRQKIGEPKDTNLPERLIRKIELRSASGRYRLFDVC